MSKVDDWRTSASRLNVLPPKASPLTRRSLIASSAAAFSAPAVLSAQSPNDEIRVGIIGVGGRGSNLLRRIIRSPGVKLVAICDIDPEAIARARQTSSEHNPDSDTYTEFRELLDRKDIDAVFVATPVNLHKEMAMAALEVHKHLYLEKPIGRTKEDVAAVMRASQTSQGLLQLGFQLRYDPLRSAAVRHVREGGIGRIAYMQADRHSGDLPRRKTWYFDASISGNMIVEQAVHILDLMNWAMDGHPVKAYGAGGINVYRNEPQGRTTYDNYICIYEYPGDVRLAFSHIFINPRGFGGSRERICGHGIGDRSGFRRQVQTRSSAAPAVPARGTEGGRRRREYESARRGCVLPACARQLRTAQQRRVGPAGDPGGHHGPHRDRRAADCPLGRGGGLTTALAVAHGATLASASVTALTAYNAVQPPSMARMEPVTNSASSEQR